mmetsp:Transcript_16415/g.34590  ORF Transcript_16415/g.34590 Transcript_16415/m.34590 type:complete len:246 (+) Transcript_16415:100-837(+)
MRRRLAQSSAAFWARYYCVAFAAVSRSSSYVAGSRRSRGRTRSSGKISSGPTQWRRITFRRWEGIATTPSLSEGTARGRTRRTASGARGRTDSFRWRTRLLQTLASYLSPREFGRPPTIRRCHTIIATWTGKIPTSPQSIARSDCLEGYQGTRTSRFQATSTFIPEEITRTTKMALTGSNYVLSRRKISKKGIRGGSPITTSQTVASMSTIDHRNPLRTSTRIGTDCHRKMNLPLHPRRNFPSNN